MQAQCKHCEKPIQVVPGHRRRSYCRPACKQAAYRQNQMEKRRAQLRMQWQAYSPLAQERLETLMRLYGEEAVQLAIDACKHSSQWRHVTKGAKDRSNPAHAHHPHQQT